MVLAGILVQALSSSLAGFDVSIISRIRLLKVGLSVSFLSLSKPFVRRRYLLASVKRRLLPPYETVFREACNHYVTSKSNRINLWFKLLPGVFRNTKKVSGKSLPKVPGFNNCH